MEKRVLRDSLGKQETVLYEVSLMPKPVFSIFNVH